MMHVPIQPAPTFVIRHGSAHAVGLWRLLRVLSKRCIVFEHDDRARESIAVGSWHGKFGYPWVCACGACCTCLSRTGRLTPLWG